MPPLDEVEEVPFHHQTNDHDPEVKEGSEVQCQDPEIEEVEEFECHHWMKDHDPEVEASG